MQPKSDKTIFFENSDSAGGEPHAFSICIGAALPKAHPTAPFVHEYGPGGVPRVDRDRAPGGDRSSSFSSEQSGVCRGRA